MRAMAVLVAALALSGCGGLDLGLPAPDDTAPDDTATEAGDPAAEAPLEPAPALGDGGAPALPLPQSGDGAAEGEAVAAAAPVEPAADLVAAAPQIYMAVQSNRGSPVSVVFAIDRSRDNTPSDEPAVRITPEQTDPDRGRCNPQQLRYFKFPAERAAGPVYGPDEAARGVGAKELPSFMATAVSQEMIARGIADDLDETRPQNVCTRKLFEKTIVAANTGQG